MALTHSSVIVTTAAVDTRTKDLLSFAFNPRPQSMTIYVRFVELGTALVGGGGTAAILLIGNAVAGQRLYVETSPNVYRVRHATTSGSVSSSLAAAPVYNQLTELRAVLNSDGSVLIGQSLAGAAETLSTTSGALKFETNWNANTIWINSAQGGAGTNGFIALRNIEIQMGVHTLQEMRVRAGAD
jgi:hypothetical protein